MSVYRNQLEHAASQFDRDYCKIMKYSVFTNDCNIDRCTLCGNSPSVTLTHSPACFLVVTPFSKKKSTPPIK